jgi:hypothetical protein
VGVRRSAQLERSGRRKQKGEKVAGRRVCWIWPRSGLRGLVQYVHVADNTTKRTACYRLAIFGPCTE